MARTPYNILNRQWLEIDCCQRIPFGQYLFKGTLLFIKHQRFHAFQVGMRQVPL